MTKQSNTSEKVLLEKIGRYIARHRLNQNMTQKELAEESGIGINTVYRIEQGQSIQLSNLIAILKTLRVVSNFDQLASYMPMSPIEQMKLKKKERQRASYKRKTIQPTAWKWNDGS